MTSTRLAVMNRQTTWAAIRDKTKWPHRRMTRGQSVSCIWAEQLVAGTARTNHGRWGVENNSCVGVGKQADGHAHFALSPLGRAERRPPHTLSASQVVVLDLPLSPRSDSAPKH